MFRILIINAREMSLNFNAPKGFTKTTVDDALVKPLMFYLKAYIVY